MTNDILARIDVARRSDSPHDMRMALYAAAAEIERLSALIPEPPRPRDSSDDERESLALALLAPRWPNGEFLAGITAKTIPMLVDAIQAAGFRRNRGRGPITDDERQAIADEISGIQVGSGYESVTIGIDAALEAADVILASPVWRNRHHDPITHEAVDLAYEAFVAGPTDAKASMRAALEAAEAAR